MNPEIRAADEADAEVIRARVAGHGTLAAAAGANSVQHLSGRGRVFRVAGWGDREWVVRHYERGGAVTGLLGDRYLRWGTPRPFREYALIRALEDAGVPTAPAVGAAVYLAGPFYRGDLVTEWIPESVDLAGVLFGAARLGESGTAAGPTIPSTEAMSAAGRLVRLMHERGVAHPDLNLKNILITPSQGGPRALIIDLDRAALRPRLAERDRQRMLDRFERSLRKWESHSGTRAPAGAREAFRDGYEAAVR